MSSSSKEEKVFNGGSLVDWIISCSLMELEADRSNCKYQLVCPAEDIVDGFVLEAVFSGQRLCVKGQEQEFVDQTIDRQIESVREAAGAKRQRIEDLNYGAGAANATQKGKDLNAAFDKEAEDVARLEQSKFKLVLDVQAAGNRYDQDLRQFEADRAKAITILRNRLGPNPKNHISAELTQMRPRAAYKKLHDIYASDAMTYAHLNSIHELMNNLIFDKKYGAVSEHMGLLDKLNETLVAAGQGKEDGELMLYLVRAILRSKDGEMYAFTVNTWKATGKLTSADREPFLGALRTLEQEATSAEAIKGKHTIAGARFGKADVSFAASAEDKKSKKPNRRRTGPKKEQASVSVGKSDGKSGFPCRKCNKTGHKTRDCNVMVTCNFCKKEGHMERFCWEKNPSLRPAQSANAAASEEKEKDLSKVKAK